MWWLMLPLVSEAHVDNVVQIQPSTSAMFTAWKYWLREREKSEYRLRKRALAMALKGEWPPHDC